MKLDQSQILPYKLEIGAVMCSVESFLFINKIPYSYSKIIINEQGEITAFIKIRHRLFYDIDTEWCKYIIDMVQHMTDQSILLTVQDS